jgi:hypothetical protein
MSPTTGSATQRSNPAALTVHRRYATSYHTQDSSRNRRPKRGNFSHCSWKNEIPCLGVQVVEL